jgi:hypothetical protein
MSRVAESLLDADSWKVTAGYFMGLISEHSRSGIIC